MALSVQISSAFCGFAAAILWWLSAQTFYAQTRTDNLDHIKGQIGDIAIQVDDGVHVVNHHSRVALTNAWAAGLSGAAVALQTLLLFFPATPTI